VSAAGPDVVAEADAQYLAQIARDCEACLGPGAELLGIEHTADESGTSFVLRYRLGSHEHERRGTGDGILAAHADLRANVIIDRLRFGFSELVDPR